MTIDIILKAFDTQIEKLQSMRAEYVKVTNPSTYKRHAKAAPKKRTMSKAARARIAEAQRKRWAKQKKDAK